jgi:hypothetical protein
VLATFNDFSVDQNGDAWSNESSSRVLLMSDLKDALIRIFNRFISNSFIEQGLKDCGGFDQAIDEITFSEFKAIYTR